MADSTGLPAHVRTHLALYTVAAYQAIALTTIQFVVPLYVANFSGSPSKLVANLLLFSMPFVGGFLLAHLFGALIDVTGRVKPFMLIALGGHLAGLALLAIAQAPWEILGASALAASFTGTLNTTLKTYVTRLSEEAKGAALSRLTQASQIGWIIGGTLAGTLFRKLTPEAARGVIFADVAITIGAIALVWALLPRLASFAASHDDEPSVPEVATTARARLRGIGAEIASDLRRLYAEPALVRGCVAAVFLQAGNWMFISTFSLFVVGHLKADPAAIGWVNVASALVTLAVLPWIGRLTDRRGPGSAIRVASIGYVVIYAILALFPSVPAAALVFSVPAYAALLIGLASAAADIGGVRRRGGGIGVVDGLWAIAVALGAACGGLVADVDLASVPLASLGTVMVGVALAWNAAPRIDARLAQIPAPASPLAMS